VEVIPAFAGTDSLLTTRETTKRRFLARITLTYSINSDRQECSRCAALEYQKTETRPFMTTMDDVVAKKMVQILMAHPRRLAR
jgi:hypothetical protein